MSIIIPRLTEISLNAQTQTNIELFYKITLAAFSSNMY